MSKIIASAFAGEDNTECLEQLVNKKIEVIHLSSGMASYQYREVDESYRGTWVKWFDNDDFPAYIYGIYMKCPTMSSIINSSVRYTIGDGIINTTGIDDQANKGFSGNTVEDIIKKITFDYWLYGGYCYQLHANDFGEISAITYVNIANVRLRKDRKVAKLLPVGKINSSAEVTIELYDKETFGKQEGSMTQLYFYTHERAKGYYPIPMWHAAILSAEIQVEVNNFHYSHIINGLNLSGIVSLPSSVTDPERKVIEKAFKEKFVGSANAGEIALLFGDEITFSNFSGDNLDEKFNTINTTTRNNLFIAAGMPPVLGGEIVQTGFNTQEFEEAFTVYNRTAAMPAQNDIENSFSEPFGRKVIEFETFTLKREVDTSTEDNGTNLAIDKLNANGLSSLLDIINDPDRTAESKREVLVLVGVSEEAINRIIPSEQNIM